MGAAYTECKIGGMFMSFGKESYSYNLSNIDRTSQVAKALSSPIRLEILNLLIQNSMTMSELSQKLYVSMSSISMHTSILKDANLISITPKPGMHGAQKLCGIKVDKISFEFFDTNGGGNAERPPKIIDLPIGYYSEAQVESPCGIAASGGYVETEDTTYGFWHPDHIQAQLIWFTTGFLRYRISNRDLRDDSVESVNISFEICAEAPGYNNVWPSDIFFDINGHYLTTFRIKGDYGGTRGINNPAWWKDSNTQYGELITLSVTGEGTYLNGGLVSRENLDSLGMREGCSFSFALGVDENGEYPGGMNLFGRSFGNYAQNIRIEIRYQ